MKSFKELAALLFIVSVIAAFYFLVYSIANYYLY